MSLLFVKRTIDSLTRQYGFPITIKRTTELSIDASTGDVTSPVDNVISVKKAIVLPNDLVRHFLSNTEVDTSDLIIYVSCAYLPKDFVLSKNNIIVYEDKEYSIVDWQKFHTYGFSIPLKRLQ